MGFNHIRKEISNLQQLGEYDKELQVQMARYIGRNSPITMWTKQEWKIITTCAWGEELWRFYEETYFK